MKTIINKEDLQCEYGISDIELLSLQDKFKKTLSFLQNNHVVNKKSRSCKKLVDVTFASNYCKNYHNELLNRVEVFVSMNKERNYIPVFITVTLDGKYRDLIFADYSRFSKDDLKCLSIELKQKMKNQEPFTNKDLIKLLSHKIKLFNNFYNRKYKSYKIQYIRVYEPHRKLGIPHLHMLMFIPNDKEIIEDLKKAFLRLFPAPRNKSTDRITKEQIKNGELNSFQISINNSLAYIMKYLQKTFLNLKNMDINNVKLDKNLGWYIKHSVRRFSMSRTIFPLWIYRKINVIPSIRDLYFLNVFLSDKTNNIFEKDYKNNTFFIHIEETKQTILYENKNLIYETHNKVIFDYQSEFSFLRAA